MHGFIPYANVIIVMRSVGMCLLFPLCSGAEQVKLCGFLHFYFAVLMFYIVFSIPILVENLIVCAKSISIL